MLWAARAQWRRQDDHHRNPGRSAPCRTPARSKCSAGAGPTAPALAHCASGSAFSFRKRSSPTSSRSQETLACSAASTERAHTVDEVLAMVELEEKRARLGKQSSRAGRSSGWRWRARWWASPDLLFLDEPTTGLDPQSRRQLWDVVEPVPSARDGTVLLTTHYMEEASACATASRSWITARIIALGYAARADRVPRRRARRRVRARRRRGAPPSTTRCARLPGGPTVRAGARADHAHRESKLHRAVPALLALLEERGAGLSMLCDASRDARRRFRVSHRPPAARCVIPPPRRSSPWRGSREFYREPEAVFWVFGFPVLLAFALGIAFRSRGPTRCSRCAARPGADPSVVAVIGGPPALAARVLDPSAAQRRAPRRPYRAARRPGRAARLSLRHHPRREPARATPSRRCRCSARAGAPIPSPCGTSE